RLLQVLPLPAVRRQPGDHEEIEIRLLSPADVLGDDLAVVAGVPTELRRVGDRLPRPALLVVPRVVIRAEEAFARPSLRVTGQRDKREDDEQRHKRRAHGCLEQGRCSSTWPLAGYGYLSRTATGAAQQSSAPRLTS